MKDKSKGKQKKEQEKTEMENLSTTEGQAPAAPAVQGADEPQAEGDAAPAMPQAGIGDEMTAKDYQRETEAMEKTGATKHAQPKPMRTARSGKAGTQSRSPGARKSAMGNKGKGGKSQHSQAKRQSRMGSSSKRHGD